jgi:methyl-accepting chemotaxis protein
MLRINPTWRIALLTLLAFAAGQLPRPAALSGLIVLPLLFHLLYRRPQRRAMQQLTAWAKQLGAGTLTAHPPRVEGLKELEQALGEVGPGMDRKIGGFILVANQVCLAGGNLDHCAGQAARNASLQADQIRQVTASSEQISVAVRQIAASAEKASSEAADAMDNARQEQQQASVAEQAAQTVLQETEVLRDAISNLGERLGQITDVVSLIRGIANQTNLLALNAGIEAARAGTHGRGFAVVANEVKNLAAHTLQATDDIAVRVQHFQEETAATVSTTGQTLEHVQKSAAGLSQVGRALSGMIDSYAAVHSQVAEISQAVHEQNEAIGGLSSSIEHTAELAQDMETTAKDVLQEAQTLTGVSDELLPLLDGFHLCAHEQARQAINDAAASPQLQTLQRPDMEDSLRRLMQQHAFVELAYVTDSHGCQITSNIFAADSVKASYGHDGYGSDWSDRPWFLGVKRDGACTVTPFYRSAATLRFCFTVACPIRDKDGQITGVLGADINVAALLNR